MIVLEHVALWTTKLEQLKDFYVQYFQGTAGPLYQNPKKSFSSYFVTFSSGARLEIMQMPTVPQSLDDVRRQFTGFIHISFGLDSQGEVERLTAILKKAGCDVLEPPHKTGDGYYESVILDPDGNRVELSCAQAK